MGYLVLSDKAQQMEKKLQEQWNRGGAASTSDLPPEIPSTGTCFPKKKSST
jgi:hypothetical protein